MTDQLNIAGSGAEVGFVIGATDGFIRPLTVADQFNFETWCRQQAVSLLVHCDNLTLQQKTDAALHAMSLGWFSDACIHATGTVMGRSRLLWLATKDSNSLSFDEFRDCVLPEQLGVGYKALARMSFGDAKKKERDGPRRRVTMTQIARLVMKVRPAYKLEDVMGLTHLQIMTLLEPDQARHEDIACGSYAEAKALSDKMKAEPPDV